MRWQGFAVGVLALVFLEVAVSSAQAQSKLGGLLQLPAAFADALINPAKTVWGTTVTPAPSTSSSAPGSPPAPIH